MNKVLLAASAITSLLVGEGAVEAATLFTQTSATGPIASPGEVSFTFNAAAGAGTAAFDVDGFLSIDGFNSCCDDIFNLDVNNVLTYSASFALGGVGSNRVFIAPAGATQNPVSFGPFEGGRATISVPLTLAQGSNTLTFRYTGFPQGTADEAFGISNLVVSGNAIISGVPEPATWAMMIGGFGMVGGAMRSARRKAKVSVSFA
jgi:hypothetical protein